MKGYMTLFAAFGIPLRLLSDFGLIVAGIWLCVLGKWGIVGYGAAALVVGFFPLYIATRLIAPLTKPSYVCLGQGNKFGFYLLGFLASLYTVAIFGVWSIGVLDFFVRQADANSIIPILLWSYGVATKPIVSLATNDPPRVSDWNAAQCAYFAQLACITAGLAVLVFDPSFEDVAGLFGVIMVGGSILVLHVQHELDGLSRRA